MKKSIKKILSVAFVVALLAGIMAACNDESATVPAPATPAASPAPAPAAPADTQPAASALEGEVLTAGSTSVQPLSDELAAAFMAANGGVTVDVQGGGSGQGVTAVQEDLVDFGALSRDLKPEEEALATGGVFVIAKDGIAMVVNNNVSVDDLTKEQLRQIFVGEVTDWSEVGGAAGAIVVIAREEGSGTRDAFNELTGVLADDTDNTVASALIQNSTGAIMTTVAGTENAIGYVSLGSLDDTVKALNVEGVAPSAEAVLDSSYVISRPFIYMTGRSPLSDAAQAFIDFVMGPEGQAIVEESGFIAVA